MFSSSWSMLLFTFLLGMLVIRPLRKKKKKRDIFLGSLFLLFNVAWLPAPTINVTAVAAQTALSFFVYYINSLHYILSCKHKSVNRAGERGVYLQ